MTKEEMLADAETQYHLLVTGQQGAVLVDHNGLRVEYTKARLRDLLAYINRLKEEIAGTTRGPMRIIM